MPKFISDEEMNKLESSGVVSSPKKIISDEEMTEMELAAEKSPSSVESFLRGAAQGATFGLSDEITGVGEATVNTLFGKDKIVDLLNNYKKYRDESRANYKAAEEANPGAYMTGDIGAGIATGLLTGAAGTVANLGKVTAKQSLLELAKHGAKQGAAHGFGNSDADLTEGDISGIVRDTVIGGGAGAVLAPATVGVAKTAGKVGSTVGKFLGDTELGQDIQKAFNLGTKGKQTYGKGGRDQFVESMKKTTDDILNHIDKDYETASRKVGEALESTDRKADVSDIIKSLEESIKNAEAKESSKAQVLDLINQYKKKFDLPLKVTKTGEVPEVNIKGEDVARQNLDVARKRAAMEAEALGENVSFTDPVVNPEAKQIMSLKRGTNAKGDDIIQPIKESIPDDVFKPGSSEIDINPQGVLTDLVEPRTAKQMKTMRDALYNEAESLDSQNDKFLASLLKDSSNKVRERIPSVMGKSNREIYEQGNERLTKLHNLKENISALRANSDLNKNQGIMRTLSKDEDNFINQLGKEELLSTLPENVKQEAMDLGDWNKLSREKQKLLDSNNILGAAFGGISQMAKTGANIAGKTVTKTSPITSSVTKTVKSITNLPDEALVGLANKFKNSPDDTMKSLGEKIETALSSADKKDRLLWSLARQPAFRELLEKEGLDLMGIDRNPNEVTAEEAPMTQEFQPAKEEQIKQLLEKYRSIK